MVKFFRFTTEQIVNFIRVCHDILESSARVLVTDGIEVQKGPTGPTSSTYVSVLALR